MRPENLRIGQHVKVVHRTDSTMHPCYLGQVGIIYKIQTSGAGVGESGNDPFVFVQFSKGVHDGFWAEELELTREKTTAVPTNVPEREQLHLIEAYEERP